MVQQRQVELAKYVEKVVKVLAVLLDLLAHELKNHRYNENLLRACTWLFNPQTPIHTTFYQLKKEHLTRYWTGTDEWRKELKKGDFVDVRVKIDLAKELNISKGWIRGRISQVRASDADIANLRDKTREEITKFMRKEKEDEIAKDGEIPEQKLLREFCNNLDRYTKS